MAENHVLLQTVALTQNASSIVLGNIPQTYTDLKIVGSARSTYAGGYIAAKLLPNGATTNTSSYIAYGSGTSTASFTDTIIYLTINGNNALANSFGNFEIYCPNYTATRRKPFLIDADTEDNVSTSLTMIIGSSWNNTSPITSFTIASTSGDLMAGSTFSVYGIASLGTTPTVAPFATGGNIVANDGTYWYHAFTSSGAFTPKKNLSCELVIVGAGGGGGADVGGGAGAGRVYAPSTTSFVKDTSYSCTVGAGGVAGINVTNFQAGYKGSDSSIIGGTVSYTSLGGGGGNSRQGSTATLNDGWNGGGGSYDASRPFTAGNGGFAGGAVTNPGSNPTYSGGGGGAAEAGNSDGTGQGGDGINTYSTWHTATNTGVSGYIAGGGGGGMYGSTTSNALGGDGGGGIGGDNDQGGGNGIANTGSGGGGAGSSQTGGTGGSGLVIIRYPMV